MRTWEYATHGVRWCRAIAIAFEQFVSISFCQRQVSAISATLHSQKFDAYTAVQNSRAQFGCTFSEVSGVACCFAICGSVCICGLCATGGLQRC